MKKIGIIMLLLLMLTTSLVFANGEPSAWAKASIEELKEYDLLRAEAFENYQDNISRADFVYLAVILHEDFTGQEIEIDPSITFEDTQDIYALKAASAGITGGTAPGRFSPDALLTREQLSTFMQRIVTTSGATISRSYELYADHDEISAWAEPSVYVAKELGILSGVGQNRFNPKGNTTVEQALLVFKRTLEAYSPNYAKLTEEEPSQPETPTGQELTTEEIAGLRSSVVKIELVTYQGEQGVGSGFFVDEETILTNFHVLNDAKEIVIVMNDGTRIEEYVGIVGYDEALDLALLKVAPQVVTPLPLAQELPNIGAEVYAIGNPSGGMLNTMSEGIISGKDDDYLQTTAPLNPGNSGGPILDKKGQVVGVAYAISLMSEENLSFVIPITAYEQVASINPISLEIFRTRVTSIGRVADLTAVYDDGSIHLNWTDIPTADYYHIYMSVNNGPFEKAQGYLGEVFFKWDEDPLTLSNVTGGANYRFKITAVKNNVETAYSNTVTINTPMPSLTQVPTNLGVEYGDNREAYITVDPIDGVDEFNLYLSLTKDGPYTLVEGDANSGAWIYAESYTALLTELYPGKTYYIKMTAYRDGAESPMSEVLEIIYPNKISFQDYVEGLGEEYPVLSLNGLEVTHQGFTLFSDGEQLILEIILDEADEVSYLAALELGEQAIEDFLFQVANEARIYYNLPYITTYMILYTTVEEDPLPYYENPLSREPVRDNGDGTYQLSYLYNALMINAPAGTYNSEFLEETYINRIK